MIMCFRIRPDMYLQLNVESVSTVHAWIKGQADVRTYQTLLYTESRSF